MRKALQVTGILLAVVLLLAVAAVGVYFFIMSNVETPDYALVEQDGKIEIRDYPALVVAEVVREGQRREAVRQGFGPLAAYIFAKERDGDKIAMTAPVTQERQKIAMTAPVTQSESGEGRWTVRFIMPSEYDLESLPEPANADVRLERLPPTRRAAIRFSGVADDALIAEQEAALRAWMAEREITPQEPPTYAYYNDPWTPGPLRRNEVIFVLEER